MKFKNLRCPARAVKAGISVEPPAKKSKTIEKSISENSEKSKSRGSIDLTTQSLPADGTVLKAEGCTEHLQTWNIPKIDVNPKAIDNVQLIRKRYGISKRIKAHRTNEWDCQPVHRRLVDPNRARNLRESLIIFGQDTISTANLDASAALIFAEKKKATRT